MIFYRSLLLLFALQVALHASDKIEAPADGASPAVVQPHVTSELIPQSTAVQPGQPFDVALHLHMDADWHTYWINPGDAGLATIIKWTLPPGFTAGPIQWPAPERHSMGPLITYGYGGDVYLVTTITPPKADLPQHLDLKAKATWLVCREECIPGKAELSLPLDTGFMNLRLPKENTELFAQARARIPLPADDVKATGNYDGDQFVLTVRGNGASAISKGVRFYAEQPNVLGTQDNAAPAGAVDGTFRMKIALQQNGDKPDKLSGVLVSDQPLSGNARAIHLAEFPISSGAPVALAVPSGGSPSPGEANVDQSPALTLLAVLGAAFLGGLILNLMPCVLPVLSLKVFSLIRHAGNDPKSAWKQGAAFTAGVVLSFWLLAGVLLLLKSAGNQLGWGFQMQSPGFVLGLTLLFFVLGLNLFGVFELGTSLVGLDAKATSHASGGGVSSFLNGALATLAATPCTAPFMGSSLGFAAQQPWYVALLIFTFLAFGMAAPYLLLTLFPGALRFVPKPGAWMESLKQFMGFLLMGTVIFLVYVAAALVGNDQVPWILFVLLLASVGAWVYGRWATPVHSTATRAFALLIVVVLAIVVANRTFAIASTPPTNDKFANSSSSGPWQAWTPEAVDAALGQGKPVFVDFTAAWCLSCKVNERVALGTDAVMKSFADKNVALFRADWTHSDPKISETLQKFHRDGVPLYLLYSPKTKDTPQVLPEVLTSGIVLDALGKI